MRIDQETSLADLARNLDLLENDSSLNRRKEGYLRKKRNRFVLTHLAGKIAVLADGSNGNIAHRSSTKSDSRRDDYLSDVT